MQDFVTLAQFTYAYEYTVLKHLLDEENIRYFFQNETVLGVVPFYANALGGIFLKVHPKDFVKAKKILDSFYNDNHLHVIK
ncbi:hypothetical protein GGR32_000721 [Mesonia hippocampi]|uniref:DUF2007 domain-containing protein n=1 Tax=Mesonia hippocampi TaxID=1628250 RepID=A0A840EU83_9FLAO|nr:DUF2007 domain-containing protein [Mesonia hippocampi]MBB4118447.1 hypothetical protein [Mesonia hippocampi]